ncbi:AAA family ATPase [Thalassiella azotivora]
MDVDRPVRRIERRPDIDLDVDAACDPDHGSWPFTVPAVAHLLRHGLDLPAGVTFLVGENGTGKSTVVEAVAEVLGIPPDGGSTDHHAGADRGSGADRSGLAAHLRAVRGPATGAGRSRRGFFLRAETMHAFVGYLQDAGPAAGRGIHPLHGVSHGESFVEMLTGHWVRRAGVVLLDEPESALSFANCLTLTGLLDEMARDGRQVLCATHSPLLTALPGARVLQLDDAGITPVAWDDLDVVAHWKGFLDAPQRYLRHVLG